MYDPADWEGVPLEDDYNTIVPKGSRVFVSDETLFDETDIPENWKSKCDFMQKQIKQLQERLEEYQRKERE